MPPLKQFTLASIALLTLALGFSACGNKNQPSQEAAKKSLMSEQPQKSPEEIIKEKADDLLGDAALAVRKFEREPSEKNFKRLMKVYDELQTLCDDEDLFRADRNGKIQKRSRRRSGTVLSPFSCSGSPASAVRSSCLSCCTMIRSAAGRTTGSAPPSSSAIVKSPT